MRTVTSHPQSGLVRLSLDFISRARQAIKQHRDRRRLLELNDHMLADIGIDRHDLTRAQAASACVICMPLADNDTGKYAPHHWC